MAAQMNPREVAGYELKALAELGFPIAARYSYPSRRSMSRRPLDMDEEEEARWEAKEKEEEAKWEAERAKAEAEQQLRREQATAAFKKALEERLTQAFAAGAESAVSAEARRAIAVRGYVLLGVVAAVVAMPLVGMLLQLDPQAFGAFIAPITGITGTIVGYWFGTVGQGPTQREDHK